MAHKIEDIDWVKIPNDATDFALESKIEDIDWSQMPEDAIEFSLEDEEYFLTWYDGDGNSWIYLESLMCVEPYEDGRERYKVSDYHPCATPNRKPTREERLDKALRTLIQTHFFGVELEWSWRDDKTLADVDPSLYKEIVDLLKIEEELRNAT